MKWHNKIEKSAFNIILIIILGFMTITMYYSDMIVTSQDSMTLIDSMFDGEFASFYRNSGAGYDVGMYIILAILGLPIWILTRFTQTSILSVGCQLWFKLIVIMFVLLCIYCIDAITKKLEIPVETRNVIKCFFLLSQIVVFPTLVVSQYDIIPVSFFLFGILLLISKRKRYALLMMAAAITMKPMIVIGVVGIILLVEKRPARIVKVGFFSALPLIVCKVIYAIKPVDDSFITSEIVTDTSNNTFFASLIPDLFKSSINSAFGQVSFFVFSLALIYAWIYFGVNHSNTKELAFYIISSQFLIWSSFILFACINPYWSIYWAPFLCLIFCIVKPKSVRSVSILAFIIESCLTLSQIVNFPWVYGGDKTFSYLVLKPIYEMADVTQVATVAGAFRRVGIETFHPAINACLLAGIISVIIILWKDGCFDNKGVTFNDESIQLSSVDLWLRLAVPVIFTIICLLCLLMGFVSL